jgi:hypothetical protein
MQHRKLMAQRKNFHFACLLASGGTSNQQEQTKTQGFMAAPD